MGLYMKTLEVFDNFSIQKQPQGKKNFFKNHHSAISEFDSL
jgi:hypothetical protein